MIRLMNENDLEQVEEIEKIAFGKEAWGTKDFRYELTENPFASIWVFQDEKIEGYIGIWSVYERVEVTNLAVIPQSRNKGIGRMLLTKADEIAKEIKATNITLEVNVTNEAAISLYKKMGYEIWATKKDYYAAKHQDAYLMGKGKK